MWILCHLMIMLTESADMTREPCKLAYANVHLIKGSLNLMKWMRSAECRLGRGGSAPLSRGAVTGGSPPCRCGRRWWLS